LTATNAQNQWSVSEIWYVCHKLSRGRCNILSVRCDPGTQNQSQVAPVYLWQ